LFSVTATWNCRGSSRIATNDKSVIARGYEFASERAVDSHIKNLRRKVEADPHEPRIIETVLAVGYRLGLARDP
jgi:DNA-binding winged helix-turn-helix (wHTH) protein